MKMMKHTEYGYHSMPDGEVDNAISKGWVLVAKKPVTIEAHEPKRRGRPRIEARDAVVEDADNGDSADAH